MLSCAPRIGGDDLNSKCYAQTTTYLPGLFSKYLLANSIKVGQFGPVVCPPLCWRKAMSPSVRVVSIGGYSLAPRSFLPSSTYTGPAATAAMNMPRASTHCPSTFGDPALI